MSTRTIRLADGTQVPAIGQGTWHMGEGQYTQQEEVRALQHGIDLGMTLVDTAEMYASGGAERVVAEAIKGRRDEVFLVSKVLPHNAGAKQAVRACEQSLKRLGTDTLDLYLLHWRGGEDLADTLDAFETLLEQGKIKRFGVSNFDTEDIEELYAMQGGKDCATNQVLYNLGVRGIEYDLLPLHRHRRLPTMAYCPLAQGGQASQRLLANETVTALAREHNVTPTQLLLAWTIRPIDGQRDVIAIPKAVQTEHIEQNAKALEIEFNEDDLKRLDEAFPPPAHKQPLAII
ncbi:aldo/keto reductase [Phytohalomonas tamaricis]|uniref:aldo/keto reductase n=1 Tax=Phytohalomonas tamaricis TaxID=2081032 RepID=UPI000D0BB4C7|nr:aldo/keto reductase [Phytohalomonas tamaricis]